MNNRLSCLLADIPFKSAFPALRSPISACSLVKYQPVASIDTVDLQRGYRFEASRLQAQR